MFIFSLPFRQRRSNYLQLSLQLIIFGMMILPVIGYAQVKEDSLIIKEGIARPLSIGDTVPLVRKDTLTPRKRTAFSRAKTDSSGKKIHEPRVATIRSAVLPGWGQVYNKKYWKLPIVYGALGITAYVFFDNIDFYQKIRYAYSVAQARDTPNFIKVDPRLLPLVENNDLASLRSNRNSFRSNIDYSVLFFIFFWGLNVLDATVDAHLKGFNVSDDLSLRIKPRLNYNTLGLAVVLDIHKGTKKMLPVHHNN